MNLVECLNWRHAAKSMNGAPVPEEKLARILEAIRLTPTSSGLQPFEIRVISSYGMKSQIRSIAMDQRQVQECSHLLVFAAWDRFTPQRIDFMFDLTNTQRGSVNTGLEGYRAFLHEKFAQMDDEAHFIQASKQVYIALGSALIAAAAERVDSTPMEGFDPDALDKLLGLREQRLRSVVIMPIGYRNPENDWNAGLVKVRRPLDQLVRYVD